MDFVVFSDDWGMHPSSCQHVFRHIAHEHRVLWVDTVGMREPKLSLTDVRKAVRKLFGMIGGRSVVHTEWTPRPPLLHVIRPPMLPLPRSALAARFNAASILREIGRAMHKLSMDDPVVVSTVPNACDAVARLESRRKIYYCVDDFSQWPGLSHDAVAAMENRLVKAVDLVVAASPVLKERFHGKHDHVELLPHGVDLNLFQQPLPPIPSWLESIPEPRVGFYGLLDERLDQQLVAGLARAMTDVSFVLAGPRVTDMPQLQALPNVHFPGNIPYERLPAFVHGLRALVMPYRVDRFTNTLAPLKLKEYLLSGLPVIVSPLAGVTAAMDSLLVASTREDWLQHLRIIVEGRIGQLPDLARQKLAGDGWDARSALMIRFALGRETSHA